jgi:hypothetical protein
MKFRHLLDHYDYILAFSHGILRGALALQFIVKFLLRELLISFKGKNT